MKVDEIARRHGLATPSDVEKLKRKVDSLIEQLKERERYNPRDLHMDLVRYRLSKETTRILQEMRKVEKH